MDDTTHESAFGMRPAGMPLPGQLVLETGDLLAARDHLSRFLWPHSVIPTARRPPVAFRHCSASLGQVSIHALHYGAAVQIEAHPDDSYLFLVLLHGAGTLSQEGFTGPLDPQLIRAMNPTGPATMRFMAGEVNLTVRIPAALLHAWLEETTGRPVAAALHFAQPADQGAGNAPGLRRFLYFLCREFEQRETGIVSSPTVCRQLERTLVSLVMTELPHNYSESLEAGRTGPAPVYIRNAEQYIRSNADQPLTLRNLAAIAGVSERTLQAGFRRYRQTTPMEYLRDHRLDLAHHGLAMTAAGGRSVTDIALACGFNHLGKFAKCYRARFGETPSETRRRISARKP
ncbi:MAG: helix-turn-helix transcriptional regulator [Gammaproteobacteria bacterium]|nr:helix-turn-helix transcriptional regulator [Gammaproteobacteria bacterium]